MKPKSDLAALDALSDEVLSLPDPENPHIAPADMAAGDWFHAASAQQLDAAIASRLRPPGAANG